MSTLLLDYDRAMKSQNTSFMNVVAQRLLDAGYEIHAEEVINHIQYLTDGITKKSTEDARIRFFRIISWIYE